MSANTTSGRKRVWSVPQENPWNAGTLPTAGNLVFQGRAEGKLIGYNAATGDIAWAFDLGLGISAPPITYRTGAICPARGLAGWD